METTTRQLTPFETVQAGLQNLGTPTVTAQAASNDYDPISTNREINEAAGAGAAPLGETLRMIRSMFKEENGYGF